MYNHYIYIMLHHNEQHHNENNFKNTKSKSKCKLSNNKCEKDCCEKLEHEIAKIKKKILELIIKTQGFIYDSSTQTTIFQHNIECSFLTVNECLRIYNGISVGKNDGLVNLNKKINKTEKGINISYDSNGSSASIQSYSLNNIGSDININANGGNTIIGNISDNVDINGLNVNINKKTGTTNIGNEIDATNMYGVTNIDNLTVINTYQDTFAYWKTTENTSWCSGFNAGKSISDNMQNNIALGFHALENSTAGYTGTSNNIAIGYYAGNTVTTHVNSVFIGSYSGTIADADNDTFIGTSSGENQLSAGSNVAVGAWALNGVAGALAYLNTAIGYQSMFNSSSGQYNCGLGAYSLFNKSSGNYNVACGYNSGFNITTNSNNTCVGYNSSPIDSTISNSTSIGYSSQATKSNQIALGTNLETVLPCGGFSSSYQRYSIGTITMITLQTLVICNYGGSGSSSDLSVPSKLPIGFIYEFRKHSNKSVVVNIIFTGDESYYNIGSTTASVPNATFTLGLNVYLRMIKIDDTIWSITNVN